MPVTVRELMLNLILNTDPDDTVEIECYDSAAEEKHFFTVNPKHVTQYKDVDQSVALIECEKENN